MTTERAYARTTDPETSHAAAVSVGDPNDSQECVRFILCLIGPATDEQLITTYRTLYESLDFPMQSESGIRSRRAELVRKGLVEFTGDKRPISSGRLARVWRAT